MRLVILGTPPRANRMHGGNGQGRRWLSAEHKAFRDAVWDACIDAGAKAVEGGRWRVEIDAYWPRRRHLDDVTLANGDCDAPIKAVLDALEHAGILDDDARVVEVVARKHWDKDRPRVVVALEAA